MGLNAKTAAGSGGRYDPLEPGSYPARLVQIVDLGRQVRSFQGEVKEPNQEIQLTYELSDEFLLDQDGEAIKDKPRWVSERMFLFNLDNDRAKSTMRYNALDPSGAADGEFTTLLGTAVDLTIVQNPGKNGKVYEKVEHVAPMRAKSAEKLPDLVNEARVFDLDEPDMSMFIKFPKWIKDTITDNLDFASSALEDALKDLQTEDPANEDKDSKENPY